MKAKTADLGVGGALVGAARPLNTATGLASIELMFTVKDEMTKTVHTFDTDCDYSYVRRLGNAGTWDVEKKK